LTVFAVEDPDRPEGLRVSVNDQYSGETDHDTNPFSESYCHDGLMSSSCFSNLSGLAHRCHPLCDPREQALRWKRIIIAGKLQFLLESAVHRL
jgi:hypothetical protein